MNLFSDAQAPEGILRVDHSAMNDNVELSLPTTEDSDAIGLGRDLMHQAILAQEGAPPIPVKFPLAYVLNCAPNIQKTDWKTSEVSARDDVLGLDFIVYRVQDCGDSDVIIDEIALRSHRHPNLQMLYGYCYADTDSAVSYLLLEDCGDCMLANLLNSGTVKDLAPHRRVRVMLEMAKAIDCLHSHYNCTAMTAYQIAIVSDTSTKLLPGMRVGEGLCPDGNCGIGSFGVVMIELLTGKMQLDDEDLVARYSSRRMKDELDLDRKEWNTNVAELVALSVACSQADHTKRPSSEQLVERLTDIYERMPNKRRRRWKK